MDWWPHSGQTPHERFVSSARFILVVTVMVYLITHEKRVFLLAAMVLGLLYYTRNIKMVGGSMYQGSTMTNPFANYLLTDDPNRPPAGPLSIMRREIAATWSNIHPFEHNKRAAARPFYTTANTEVVNDQEGFAVAAYGAPFAPHCHDQGGAACSANINFPERFVGR